LSLIHRYPDPDRNIAFSDLRGETIAI
jgi:hypothetical protein